MEEIKTAKELKEWIIDNQINIIYRKILNAAQEGLYKTSFKIDFSLSDSCLTYFRAKGYNIKEMQKFEQYNYYDISWK